MTLFNAVAGQSIFDVCVNTYGSLDYLVKLMQDNGVANVDAPVITNQAFLWDETLVSNQNIQQQIQQSNIVMATKPQSIGAKYFTIVENGALIQPVSDIFTPSNPATVIKYQITKKTDYTASVDGENVITLSALIGYDILQVENETKPLYNTDYVWNKATGVLTLLNGISLAAGQSLFILYQEILNS